MADRDMKIPPGFEVPDGYFKRLGAQRSGFRQSPPGMSVPEGYFEQLEQKYSEPPKPKGQKSLELWPMLSALIASAAVLACFFWLDGFGQEQPSWEDISNEELTRELVYSETDFYQLINQKLDADMIDNLPSGMEEITENELEESINLEINQLEIWYE